jgi:glycosyltransferase involved in cell wall biosynthesis
MKIVWLCNYSLFYLKDKVDTNVESKHFHPATWLLYLQEEIRNRQNIELHIIAISAAIKEDITVKDGNVFYYFYTSKKYKIPGRVEPYLSNYFLYRKIVKLINNIKPDIVTAHGTEGHHGLILNKLDYPSIVWIQGLIHHVVKYENSFLMRRKLKNEIKVFRKQKRYITIPSNMEEIILKNQTDAKFFHLYYPISSYAFTLKNEKDKKENDIIYVGQIVKRKGAGDLIEAVYHIKKQYSEIKVTIIGFSYNNYIDEIKTRIKHYNLQNNVRIMGSLPNHDDVMREVKISKIFILPTYVDTGPRAVAESMAIGTPVISYNIDGLPVMIKNGVSGILVEKGNIQQLAEAAICLLNDEKKRTSISEEAYKYALDNFSAPNIVDKLINIYKNIIIENKN